MNADTFIARGAYGKVWKVNDQPKVIKRSKISSKALIEAHFLTCTRHQNIMSVSDVYATHKHVVMKMPHAEDTFTILPQENTQLEAIKRAWELGKALEFIESEGFRHNDVKPDNVLMLDGQVKLIDFGFISMYQYNVYCGSATFRPPEVLMEIIKGSDKEPFTRDVETWSYGLTIFCMLAGVKCVSDLYPEPLSGWGFLKRWVRDCNTKHHLTERVDFLIDLGNVNSIHKDLLTLVSDVLLVPNPKERGSVKLFLEDPLFNCVRESSKTIGGIERVEGTEGTEGRRVVLKVPPDVDDSIVSIATETIHKAVDKPDIVQKALKNFKLLVKHVSTTDYYNLTIGVLAMVMIVDYEIEMDDVLTGLSNAYKVPEKDIMISVIKIFNTFRGYMPIVDY